MNKTIRTIISIIFGFLFIQIGIGLFNDAMPWFGIFVILMGIVSSVYFIYKINKS